MISEHPDALFTSLSHGIFSGLMLFVPDRTKEVMSEVSKLPMARSARTYTLLDNGMTSCNLENPLALCTMYKRKMICFLRLRLSGRMWLRMFRLSMHGNSLNVRLRLSQSIVYERDLFGIINWKTSSHSV
jgi:hypothetical protein